MSCVGPGQVSDLRPDVHLRELQDRGGRQLWGRGEAAVGWEASPQQEPQTPSAALWDPPPLHPHPQGLSRDPNTATLGHTQGPPHAARPTMGAAHPYHGWASPPQWVLGQGPLAWWVDELGQEGSDANHCPNDSLVQWPGWASLFLPASLPPPIPPGSEHSCTQPGLSWNCWGAGVWGVAV